MAEEPRAVGRVRRPAGQVPGAVERPLAAASHARPHLADRGARLASTASPSGGGQLQLAGRGGHTLGLAAASPPPSSVTVSSSSPSVSIEAAADVMVSPSRSSSPPLVPRRSQASPPIPVASSAEAADQRSLCVAHPWKEPRSPGGSASSSSRPRARCRRCRRAAAPVRLGLVQSKSSATGSGRAVGLPPVARRRGRRGGRRGTRP